MVIPFVHLQDTIKNMLHANCSLDLFFKVYEFNWLFMHVCVCIILNLITYITCKCQGHFLEITCMSPFFQISRSFSLRNLQSWLRSNIAQSPYGISSCIATGRRLSWPLGGMFAVRIHLIYCCGLKKKKMFKSIGFESIRN